MLTCDDCGANNPKAHRFCSSCGSPLGGEAMTSPDLDVLIRKRVDALLQDQLRSRELVQATIEEEIAGRMFKVMKWIGYVLALPAFLVVVAFGAERQVSR